MADTRELNIKPSATSPLEFALGIVVAILGFLVLVAGVLIVIF
ncbi:MAG: hypothetical protein AB1523_09880 [Bacillota bacterium]